MGSRLVAYHTVCILAPWQIIRVAPFKFEVYLTARGEAVILSELY